MAGGVGSRFWPSSTTQRPKQFLDILGIGKSLIRMTFERSVQVVPVSNVLIMTNVLYKDLVKKHLPEIPEQNILCEPSMNNTAPCVAYATFRLQAMNPKAVFAVLPSDHVILKEEEYISILKDTFTLASKNDVLITLGIQPNRPDTGYGYIQFGHETLSITSSGNSKERIFYKVKSFKEKPDVVTAQSYLESKEYLWNAGMFIWSVQSILKAFYQHAGDIVSKLGEMSTYYNTEEEQSHINQIYPMTPNISIDYAIMEKADNVYTIPVDIGWSDLGTWNSLHAYLANENRNVIIGEKIHVVDSDEIIVMSNNQKMVVIKGLKDYIVVDEDDALLIYPKKDEQEIKEVVKKLDEI